MYNSTTKQISYECTVLYILCIINAHVDSWVWMTAQICEYLSTQYLRKCCTYLGIIVWPQISSSYKDGGSYLFLLSFEAGPGFDDRPEHPSVQINSSSPWPGQRA